MLFKSPKLSVGVALSALKQGQRVTREGWGAPEQNIYIELQEPDQNSKMTQPYIFMNTPEYGNAPYALCNEDIMEDDWRVISVECKDCDDKACQGRLGDQEDLKIEEIVDFLETIGVIESIQKHLQDIGVKKTNKTKTKGEVK